MPTYKAEQIIEALKTAKGLKSHAAKALGCSRNTIDKYIKDYPTVATAYAEVNEKTIDDVESKLLNQIDDENITAIIFYLKTKAKHRGYIERQEVTGKDGSPVVYQLEYPKD